MSEGHFRVGPFYILQDEFLTSGEANVRNLQTGIREAKAYGNLTKVGYFRMRSAMRDRCLSC